MSWREATKKPATPITPKPVFTSNDDDWETDLTYQNNSTEKSQRYGSASVPGSGRKDHIDLGQIHDKMKMADVATKTSYQEKNPNRGYGGKFGTEQVMDKTAVDFSYKADISKHPSQTDGKKSLAGIHGVDKNVQDKSNIERNDGVRPEAHTTQTDAMKTPDVKVPVDIQKQDQTSSQPKSLESSTEISSGKDKVPVPEVKTKTSNETKVTSTSNPTASLGTEKPSTPQGPRKISSLLQRFENIKKEQEQETMKRIATVRSERFANEDHLKQTGSKRDEKVQSENKNSSGKTTSLTQVPVEPRESQETTQPEKSKPVKAEETMSSMASSEDKKIDELKYSTTDETLTSNSNKISDQGSESAETSSNEEEGEFIVPQTETEVQSRTERSIENESENADTLSTPEQRLTCIVKFSYQKSEDDELDLTPGDVISEVEKRGDLWWYGTIGSHSGIFPADHVEEIK